jgi:Auxiliary Activity family 9 (formerly GH61)
VQYLAYLPEPNAKPSTLSWFKILGRGYDAKAKLWANEELIKSDRKDTFQLPSDIKPGMYILRTELVSLHYATRTGAQFYPHCFNIEIRGPGTATPEGVKIPGAYSAKDPYLAFEL